MYPYPLVRLSVQMSKFYFYTCKLSLYIIFTFITCSTNSSAQSLQPGMENFTPPNPDVAALVKYAESPVSYSSGSVQVAVPIYAIKSKNLSTSVSISYHGSSIRTKQEASSVGLGWSLQAGGVISRTVMGIPDEYPLGYQNKYGLFNTNDAASMVSAVNSGHDLQPDIYHYNFQGYSGKFFEKDNMNGNNNEIIKLDDNELKIIHNGPDSWTIIDPTGNKFVFEEIETGFYSAGTGNATCTTAWLLSEVYSPNNVLEFTYTYSEQSVSHGLSHFAGTKFKVTNDNCQKGCFHGVCCEDINDNFNATSGTTGYKTLKKITGAQKAIEFTYTNRSDINGAVKLDKVELINITGVEICHHKLSYGYFGPSNQKLKLNQIQKIGATESEEPYIFDYTTTTLLDKAQGSFDHWGYPNQNAASGLFPPSTINELEQMFNGDQCFGFPARDPDNFSSQGMLKKVTFPTGGYEEFEWENHDYSSIIDPSQMVSSQHIDNTIVLNAANGQTITSTVFPLAPDYPIVKLELTSTTTTPCDYGIPCRATVNIYKDNTLISTQHIVDTDSPTPDESITYINLSPESTFPYSEYYVELILNPSNPTHEVEAVLTYHEMDPTSNVMKLTAGGSRIKSITTPDGVRSFDYVYNSGETLYSSGVLLFAPKYHFNTWTYKGCDVTQDCGIAICRGNTVYSNNTISSLSGDHIFYTDVRETYQNNSEIHYKFDYTADLQTQNNYPRQPYITRSPLRGQLLEKKVYQKNGSSNTLISSEVNNYSYSPTGGIGGHAAIIVTTGAYRPDCPLPHQVIYTSFTYAGFRKVLDSKSVTLDGVTTDYNYTYSPTYQTLLASESVVNSDSKTYTSEYSYMDSYSINSGLKDKMLDQNRILPAWQSIKKVGGTIVDGQRILYGYATSSTGAISVPTQSNPGSIIYPRDLERREITWDNGTYQDNGWHNDFSDIEYNISHGLVTKRLAEGWQHPIELTYNSIAQLTERKTGDFIWSYDYDIDQQLKSVTDVDGQVINFTYDDLLRLHTRSERSGAINSENTYSYLPNFISSTSDFGTDVSLSSKTHIDALGRVSQLDKIAYTESGSTTQATTIYNSRGLPDIQSDFIGNLTSTEYYIDPLDRVKKVTDPEGFETEYIYGTNSNEVSGYAAAELFKTEVIDPDGIKSITYTDKIGRQVMSRQSKGPDYADTYTQYDDKSRVTKVIPPDATEQDNGLTYRYTYDGDDNVITKKIPDKPAITFLYDDRNLMIGNKDALMTSNGKQWMAMTYDEYGRPLQSGFGNVSGTTVTISELLITNSYDGTGTSNATNDIYKGRMHKSVTNILDGYNKGNNDIITDYTFDLYGRVDTETITNPLIGNETMTYTYDMADNILSVTHVTPVVTSVTTNYYDTQGRLQNTTLKVGNGPLTTIVSDINYTDDDLIENKHLRTGTEIINYSYNNNRWLTNINVANTNYTTAFECNPNTASPLIDFSLYYNQTNPNITNISRENGNISSATWSQGGIGNMSYAYEYDYLNRITKATSSNNNGFGTDYTYADKRGNISTITRQGYVMSNNCYTPALIDDLTLSYANGTNRLTQVADAAAINNCPDYEHLGVIDQSGNYGVNVTLSSDAVADPDKDIKMKSEGNIKLESGFKFNSDGTGTFKAENDDCPDENLLSSGTMAQNGFIENSITDYGYDDNGNLSNDTDKGVVYTYNHLNLPYIATKGTDKVEWIYTAAGQKIRKTTTIDATPSIKDYYGSTEKDDNGYVVYHSEGQVRQVDNVLHWEYAIRDHLGNTRILYDDHNGDNSLDILQNNQYYAFGMSMYGEWSKQGMSDNDYKYNGKELNGELGLRLYDYGARFYDPAIGRFPSVDRFAGKFTHQSSYAYAANNPIKFIDVNGDSIKIGNETYMPNQGYEGDDNFIKSAFMALDYLYNNGADLSGVICDLACSEETVEIKENTKENNPFIKNAGMQTYFDSNHESGGDPYIIWSDRGGLEFDTKTGWGQILFGDIGKRSPAEGLLHELAHAQSFLKNRSQHIIDSKTPVRNYTNREEYDVINQIENPASEALRGEEHIGRYRHSGRFYRTVSPTSTEKEKK